MPRSRRRWISGEAGSFHIISRIAGGDILLHRQEKEYFLKLLERLAAGFFVQVHAFCIMGNHFHILASGQDKDAEVASKEELVRRYRLIYGEDADPPKGSYDSSGQLIADADGGVERLRRRLGSVSRFVQELKQGFSRWYNKRHHRQGFLWGGRFRGVLIYKGEPRLACSAYIDLNPVRAGLSERPEKYRWSSLGMRVRSPVRAGKLLRPISLVDVLEESEYMYGPPYLRVRKELFGISWYREFVNVSGGIERQDRGSIPPRLVDEVVMCSGALGLTDRLRYRWRNFSEGIAIGGHEAISGFQKRERRKLIHPRALIDSYWCYTTRVLRL
jgi:REP element-mobilizing transposase RayT